jgi:hypothetical protein
MGDGPQNLEAMTTIYGPTTWEVYERLDPRLDPHGANSLYDLAAEHIGTGARVLIATWVTLIFALKRPGRLVGARDAVLVDRRVVAHSDLRRNGRRRHLEACVVAEMDGCRPGDALRRINALDIRRRPLEP